MGRIDPTQLADFLFSFCILFKISMSVLLGFLLSSSVFADSTVTVMVQGPKTGCEGGYHQPATWEECQAVASVEGIHYWGGSGHSSGADPAGCIYRTPDQDVYFNTHATGSTNRNDRKTICVKEITWMQGPKTGCGAGYHQPATWEECQTLASAADIH